MPLKPLHSLSCVSSIRVAVLELRDPAHFAPEPCKRVEQPAIDVALEFPALLGNPVERSCPRSSPLRCNGCHCADTRAYGNRLEIRHVRLLAAPLAKERPALTLR